MSDPIVLAIVALASTAVTTLIGTLGKIIIAKINKIQSTVNGRLTDLINRCERAEARSPGITRIPDHMETIVKVTVNDPTNDDKPVSQITETKPLVIPEEKK